MSLTITIVGTADRQLEEILRAPTTRIKTMPVAELLALAQPSASQPDVVILDLRETQCAAADAGHAEASASDDGRHHRRGTDGSGADARGDARRRDRVDLRPDQRRRAERGRRARELSEPVERAGPDLRVHRRQGRRRHDDDCRQRRDRAGAGGRGRAHAPDGLPPVLRRRRGLHGRRAAILRRRRDGEHAPARRGVLREPRRAEQIDWRAPAGIGRTRRRPGRSAAHRDAAAVCRDALSLYAPRRAALGSRRARFARGRGDAS